ncbi:hypothetical protein [Winogradskyella sp.]|uniref:hypothetical protein n=1 Tax=Winogradskyella sp. TaxID=1883156 RepID=UPI002612D006|nr:hypothetical protein [Winogradskyella sp.]
MKRILSFITVFALVLTACEGDPGPPGPPGFDGLDSDQFAAEAFEIVLDFTPQNNYEFIEPYGFPVAQSSVTLVYISWEVDNGQDIWRLLPQTVIFEDGNDLVYNFDFTQNDVRFFLEGSDLDGLDAVWTQAQVFRVVVLPTLNAGRLDVSNIDAVMEAYNITSFESR